MSARVLDRRRRRHVKKNQEKDQEQKGKALRLTLSRETLKVLDGQALLRAAQGGIALSACSSSLTGGGGGTGC
jgi:hypothetical protein